MAKGYREGSPGFASEDFDVRQDGGSDAACVFGRESSGLDIPTKRNTFPMARTTGCIFSTSLYY